MIIKRNKRKRKTPSIMINPILSEFPKVSLRKFFPKRNRARTALELPISHFQNLLNNVSFKDLLNTSKSAFKFMISILKIGRFDT